MSIHLDYRYEPQMPAILKATIEALTFANLTGTAVNAQATEAALKLWKRLAGHEMCFSHDLGYNDVFSESIIVGSNDVSVHPDGDPEYLDCRWSTELGDASDANELALAAMEAGLLVEARNERNLAEQVARR